MSDDHKLYLVFIRAPRIVEVGPRALVLARFGGEPILVRQGNVVGATFHPELTPQAAVHATWCSANPLEVHDVDDARPEVSARSH